MEKASSSGTPIGFKVVRVRNAAVLEKDEPLEEKASGYRFQASAREKT